jgi:RHS repeat-associated protein
VAYTYDGNQNLTFDGTNTLTYDVENRLIQAQNLAWGTSQYLYDPLGRRKQKQVGDVITQFVLAGEQEIADYHGEGVGVPWMLTVRGVGGLPVAAITPATSGQTESVAYYHHDVLGSTVAATQAGTPGPAEVYVYSEFGEPGGGSFLPYQFAGYRYDNETGLYYVRARYYSPTLGRFLQADPIGIAGGRNLYAYVGNDPINLIDPLGLSADESAQSAQNQKNHSCYGGDAICDKSGKIVETRGINDSSGIIFVAVGWIWGGLEAAIAKSGAEVAAEGEGAELLEQVGQDAIQANKLNHIFGNAAHDLDSVVSTFGSEEAAFRAIQQGTEAAVQQQGLTGVFQTTVQVGGETITVRGAVVNGAVKIGTAFK